MKKCRFIYNPVSGNKVISRKLDRIIAKLQKKGYLVEIFRSMEKGDLSKSMEGITDKNFSSIIIAGGDGSLNIVINQMLKNNIDLPVGIIPAGTANDFATYLNIPQDPEQAVDIIDDNNIKKVDIGNINDRYFINVCMVGEFSNVPQDTNTDFKNILGKMAYYLNGIKEIPNLKPVHFQIKTDMTVIDEKLYMFLILNSSGAGGFKNLSPEAKINDGLFDFIGVRYKNYKDLYKLPTLLMQVLQGEHLTNNDIIHLKEKHFQIECLDSSLNNYHCDIDGEKGPVIPLDISVLPEKLRIYSSKII